MMKRIFCFLMILCMCFSASASVVMEDYTDVPSVMTQDSVLEITVDQECEITLMEPDERAMALLEKIYAFVWDEHNRPARYYDEETQRKIAELSGVDPDILHMTEFMAQEMQGEPEEEVLVERLLDVDYQPGQLVVVVLGIQQEDGEYRWFPYRAEVPSTGLITFRIPSQEYGELVDQQVIYHVLTTRVGARGNVITEYEEEEIPVIVPSKNARDIVRVTNWRAVENTEEIKDDFSIFLVEKTRLMEEEILRIGEHLAQEKPALAWFPEDIQEQAQLLMPQDDAQKLMIYDIVALMARNYKDTYGDVACEQTFASVYDEERSMVAILGFPIEDAQEAPYMEWYCLRAEAIMDFVEIVYKQLVIPQMETEPAMLVVLSQPLED